MHMQVEKGEEGERKSINEESQLSNSDYSMLQLVWKIEH